MGNKLVAELAAALGRPPSCQEVAVAKAQRDAAVADALGMEYVVSLIQVVGVVVDGSEQYTQLAGATRETEFLLLMAAGNITPTLAGVREKASECFAGNAAWHVFIGQKQPASATGELKQLKFIGSQCAWEEQIKTNRGVWL